MARLVALFLVFAGAAAGNGPSSLDQAVLHAHDFAALTDAEARRLEGKPALFRVTLDTDCDTEERDGSVCANCVGDGDAPEDVYLCSGQKVDDTMTVEAILQVRYCLPLVGADGGRLPALWEYRLARARLVL
jgi:hypothetical protein